MMKEAELLEEIQYLL